MRRYLLFLMLAAVTSSTASEPPRDTIDQAVQTAEVVFLGRVVQTTETEYKEHSARGEAKVLVLKNLIGLKCSAPWIRLSYTVFDNATDDNTALFKIATNYVFALRNDTIGENCTGEFVSRWSGPGIDLAFEAADAPQGSRGVAFVSVYGQGKPCVRSLVELEKLARKRKMAR